MANFTLSKSPVMHVYGLWGETGEPRGNPIQHKKNMHTPQKSLPGLERKPFCCEVTDISYFLKINKIFLHIHYENVKVFFGIFILSRLLNGWTTNLFTQQATNQNCLLHCQYSYNLVNERGDFLNGHTWCKFPTCSTKSGKGQVLWGETFTSQQFYNVVVLAGEYAS